MVSRPWSESDRTAVPHPAMSLKMPLISRFIKSGGTFVPMAKEYMSDGLRSDKVTGQSAYVRTIIMAKMAAALHILVKEEKLAY